MGFEADSYYVLFVDRQGFTLPSVAVHAESETAYFDVDVHVRTPIQMSDWASPINSSHDPQTSELTEPEPEVPAEPEPESFPTALVVTASAAITSVIGIALLVYFAKLKKPNKLNP